MVLRRLSPDKVDFVFANDQERDTGPRVFNFNSTVNLADHTLFERLNESMSIHPSLFGDFGLEDIVQPHDEMAISDLRTDEAHVDRLVEFYFAHSHTLYPIIHRGDFLKSLHEYRSSGQDPLLHPPLFMFRMWMVLAIGSTAFSAISLTEESESRQYYQEALRYIEQAMSGDFAALEVIMLQVSYSFFNQLGPNTWFLVGMAARLALGLGLHSSSTYVGIPVDIAQSRKRLFFSVYMMDRVVSIALGRPFALHDDDIDVSDFAAVDEECIGVDGIQPPNPLHPSLLAVPLHILALRRIAGKIARKVYANNIPAFLTSNEREKILHSLHEELVDWRRNMPFPLPDISDRVPQLTSNWFDFNYYTHLAMIYRPSPMFPTMDHKRVKILEEAASMSIRQAYSMHRQGRFAYNWLNLLSIFTSTLSLIYSTNVQPDDLVTVLKQTRAIEDLDLVIELFDTLGFKFSVANKLRGMVADISSRYKDLRASSETT
ncbi:hypothetical protein N0V82_001079 [Gnomoniopsis sp. IMI 355080]|nr:hypothetical protein N0V82_001079 [Gnomoniopsis sp. IMI 355080]